MFRYRNHLRRWAAFALLLWSWAIASSLAHACLAPQTMLAIAGEAIVVDSGTHHHSTVTDNVAPVEFPVCGAGAVKDAADVNCANFCVKASVSFAPLQSALDSAQAHAPLLPTTVAVLTMPAAAPVQLPAVDNDADTAASPIPIPIAFLRLTR